MNKLPPIARAVNRVADRTAAANGRPHTGSTYQSQIPFIEMLTNFLSGTDVKPEDMANCTLLYRENMQRMFVKGMEDNADRDLMDLSVEFVLAQAFLAGFYTAQETRDAA